MSNSFDDAVSRLASQSDAIGQLAQDSGGFSAVIAAFESKDASAFRWVLERLEMLPYCELICEWVRIKFGVLRCLEVCGLPNEELEAPTLQQFARAIVQLASNEKLLRQVVDSVSCGDGEEYRAAIAELELNDFCYLLCHWVYSVIYYRVCEVVCSPNRLLPGDAVSEIRAAAREIDTLLRNEKAFDVISEAAVALNCEILKSAIDRFGLGPQCRFICRLVCSWRYVWVCREFCLLRNPVFNEASDIEEARNFALASRRLGSQPRVLADLVSAAQSRDTKAYAAIIDRFGLRPYCYQVCAWINSVTCHEFCYCVCPPSANPPLFYQVGNFNIYSQIDPTTGLTNTQVPNPFPPGMPFGGGPNFAFFEQLQLGGWCPATSPTFPGQAMKYRFLYAKNQTTLAGPITSPTQTSIVVTSNVGIPTITPFNISVCYSDSPYETAEIMTVNSASALTWTVVRGVDGTAAATLIPSGATVAVNPAPLTLVSSLVDSPVQVGARTISWPTKSGTNKYTTPIVSVSEPVYVGPGTDPTPTLGQPYQDPAHYIQPDANGWVNVDQTLAAGGVSTLLSFNSVAATPGGCELPSGQCFDGPGGAPAGTAVPSTDQQVGTDLTIIFQATRVGAATVDYSNSLCRIHVNNWQEVNNLWLQEFGLGSCCNPIDTTLSVEFTVDHEMMSSGGWSLEITSTSGGTTCSPSAPGSITPTVSSPGPPPVTVTSRGGSGTIVENTTAWDNCSYQVLQTARAGLTTGLLDNDPGPLQLTFCICGHENLPVPAAEGQAKNR